ncbi:class I SAM-dependent methyltransferase [Saccharopolyspora sp. NFXS83]|uniref:class I SAM-dependent methyltransferase n=1 Tax=Saccharopolyspora sp. NFXS83 TaxID=2993560 RepID=UPI00224B2FB3|nr:class I SAM-dependent methyltransferase [Saccharopolyspora sp. NFXS83]MCX2729159.1 class I SAM-dependent methyltransferase [Saccharopolyspora sp. NFXS83]
MQSSQEAARIRKLILAAGGGDERIREAIRELGEEWVASALLDELVHRAELGAIPQLAQRPITVRFELGHDGATTPCSVRSAGAETVTTVGDPDGDETAHATVELDLLQLTRAVFGPCGAGTAVDRRISWRDFEEPEALAADMHVLPVVQHLLSGTVEQPIDLSGLSLRYGSDKWGLHFYAQHYERHFGPLRDRPLVVLELGIGGYDDPAAGGGSLRMWKRFLPRSLVYGVDVFDKSQVAEQRLFTVRGDQADPEFLESLIAEIGPVDIVIDDGSHYCPDVVSTFRTLFRHVVPGGLYVIEDLQTSYWPAYGGTSARPEDPATTMGFLKQLLDGLHHEEFLPAGAREPSEFDRTVVGAHFYHNLVFLEKGRNAEGTIPQWVGRERPI